MAATGEPSKEPPPLYELDRDKLLKRVQRITSAWSWPLDALVLVTGKTSDEASEHKVHAMHHYLLGIEFPETAVVLFKSGNVLFISSATKSKYLQQVAGPNVELVARASGAYDDAQMQQLATRLKQEKEKPLVGTLLKETHVGQWATAFAAGLSACDGLQVMECRDEISQVLAIKDEAELKLSERAAFFTQLVMDERMVKKVEEIIDRELKQQNQEVCTLIEGDMESEVVLKDWAERFTLDPAELALVYASVQSGQEFELKPDVPPTEAEMPMQGTYVLSLGMKYSEYSACISRTLLVDVGKVEREAYHLALEVQALVFACLKPDVVFKEIYVQARKMVEKKKGELLPYFVKNVGFAMGLEFKDPQMMITEKSTRKIVPGMVFCISVGFSDNAATKPWAVWIADTAHILPEGSDSTCIVTTEKCTKKPSDVMYELEQPAADVAESEAPAAAQTLPAKPDDTKNKAAAKAKAKTKEKDKPAASGKKSDAKKPEKAAKREKEHPQKPQKRERPKEEQDARREQKEKKAIGAAEILERRKQKKMSDTKEEIEAKMKLEQQNVDLREAKLKELRERFSDAQPTSSTGKSKTGLTDVKAYASSDKMPLSLRPNRLHMDMTAETLMAPICGAMVPFHVRTIKNMSRSEHDRFHMLRVNFFTPGLGKSLDDYPKVNGNRVYVKELSFRSQTKDNLEVVLLKFKEIQKRSKQREIEGEVKKAQEASGMEDKPLVTMRSFPCLRDITCRPSPGGRGRTSGTLEAHTNGLRYSMKGGGEKIDLLYSRIQHAVFSPCEGNSLLVIIHFHLKEAMMIGKKRSQDIQFLAEGGVLSEDLSKHKTGSTHDPDEILEEQREREWIVRLNSLFQDFVKKVEAIQGCPFNFDMPYTALAFAGVPFKQSVKIFPCERALVSVEDWPPFCLDLDSIDIVVFERCLDQLQEFDLVFVLKDFDQAPIRITTVPSQRREIVRTWLTQRGIPFYSCTMNMQWQVVMRDINADRLGFVENGGWDTWFIQSDDEASATSGEEHAEDDYGSNDISDSDEFGGCTSSGEFEGSSNDVESSSSAQSEPSDGESWDELERKAERADRKRDADAREAQTAKRTRR